MHAALRALSGVEPYIAVDNCAAPCYGLPLANMASCYEALARPSVVREFSPTRRGILERVGSLDAIETALDRIGAAMALAPEWVSGRGTAVTRLAHLDPGLLVAKHGAEGILCVAHRGNATALALKATDGAARALIPALVPFLGALGWLPASALGRLQDAAEPILRGNVGQVFGKLAFAPPE
jgi:L-asparaginase II